MKNKNLSKKIGCMILVLLIFCISHLIAEPCGDVNSDGSIDIIDALLVAQHYVGLDLENFDENAADVNGDGSIAILDALLIAQYYVGLIPGLPGCEEPTPTPGSVTYELEAEDAEWSSGSVREIGNIVYVDTDNLTDEWIEWSFDLSADSTADCVFRYACASSDRTMALSINGSVVANLPFPVTGSWDTWESQTTDIVTLSAGSVVIRVTALTSDGAPNMDKMVITITGGVIVTPTETPTPVPTETPEPTAYPVDIAIPDGYAAGTTGGGNAPPITITSASAFRSAVDGSDSAVIIVNGSIDLGGDVEIGSNKTIKGANSSSPDLYDSAVKPCANCIFQNLTFGPHTVDVVEVSGATMIFFHKCSFHDSSGDLCSIGGESEYVTISWCRFYFDSSDSQSFAHLIDGSRLRVTMHHNWYDNGVVGRMPRVRSAYVHIYNNYYSSNTSDYCIGIDEECYIRLENTVFDNVNDPWADLGGSGSGEIHWSNCLFIGCTPPVFMPNAYPGFTPPYSYNMDPVENVESIVRNGAGNR